MISSLSGRSILGCLNSHQQQWQRSRELIGIMRSYFKTSLITSATFVASVGVRWSAISSNTNSNKRRSAPILTWFAGAEGYAIEQRSGALQPSKVFWYFALVFKLWNHFRWSAWTSLKARLSFLLKGQSARTSGITNDVEKSVSGMAMMVCLFGIFLSSEISQGGKNNSCSKNDGERQAAYFKIDRNLKSNPTLVRGVESLVRHTL